MGPPESARYLPLVSGRRSITSAVPAWEPLAIATSCYVAEIGADQNDHPIPATAVQLDYAGGLDSDTQMDNVQTQTCAADAHTVFHCDLLWLRVRESSSCEETSSSMLRPS